MVHPRGLDPHAARHNWSKRCMGISSLNMLASAVTFITSTPEGITNAIEASCKDIKGNEYSRVVSARWLRERRVLGQC